MFIFSAVSIAFRIQICSCFVRFLLQIRSYKSYVRVQCNLSSISNTNRLLHVRFPCEFCRSSYINQRLQTLCSFSVRFLLYFAYKSEVTNPMFIFSVVFSQHFAYKSEVTNPMFVFRAISGVFRIQTRGYKSYVHFQWGFFRPFRIQI